MLVSDVFIVMPGGIGTLLETAMVWQLLQVKKLYNTPLILVGTMWSELVRLGEAHNGRYPVAAGVGRGPDDPALRSDGGRRDRVDQSG